MKYAAVVALASVLAAVGCSKKEPPPKLVQSPSSTLKAVTEVTCPGCKARLRPQEVIRPQPSSPMAVCPKCNGRIPPPGAAEAPK
jgi:hypothetical protein